MVLKYQTGEEILKGDRVLYHGKPGHVEFVAAKSGDPETDWYVDEYGGGIMVVDGVAGHTFIPTDRIEEYEDLGFVSRADTP